MFSRYHVASIVTLFGLFPGVMTADVLSNNLSNTTAQTYTVSGSTDVAVAFKTDANSYTLNAVTLLLANQAPGQATLTLYSDASGRPGLVLATLTSPASYSSGASAVTFTANGITLTANTTYWLGLHADSGRFDWSWTADNTGAGVGFLHQYAISGSGGWTVSSANQPQVVIIATPLNSACAFNLSSATVPVPVGGGTGSVNLTANPGCNSTSVSNASWITVTSGASNSGNGTVSFSAIPNNTGFTRVGTITIGGQTLFVTQASTTCSVVVTPTTVTIPSGGGSGSVAVSNGAGCPYNAISSSSGVTITSGQSGSGNATVNFTLPANSTSSPVSATLTIGGATVAINQASNVCAFTITPLAITMGGAGGNATINFTGGNACPWSIQSNASWITLTSNPIGVGSGSVTLSIAPNTTAGTRIGTLTLAGQTITVTQSSTSCSYSLSSSSQSFNSTGGPGTITVTTQPGCSFTATSNNAFVTITSGGAGTGTGTVNYTVQANAGSTARSATITVAGLTFTVSQGNSATSGTPLQFVPVTLCRIADTRNAAGPYGGPKMNAGETRSFNIPGSTCGIPATAAAYALQLSVFPTTTLTYATLWPTGQAQPLVSTLNSFDGRSRSNSAIITAGTGGAVSVFTASQTDIALDIAGYFVPANSVGTNGLTFFPVTPCRILDTRNAVGPLGGPFLTAGTSRTFPVQTACGLPAAAQAYSLNITTVSRGVPGQLTVWPSGQAQPAISTPTSPSGTVAASAEIVAGGTAGSINIATSSDADVIVDVNGYFAPTIIPGGLNFYALNPCRVLDSRVGTGPFGGPVLAGGQSRTIPVLDSPCGVPATAQAYALNATAVPVTNLDFLTLWPAGQNQPVVSTLNSFDGAIVANAAIVPVGTNGGINAFVTKNSHLVLDINGYFAP